MADEASETLAGAFRNWLGALGFILPLVGVEELIRHFVDTQHPSLPPLISTALVLAGLLFYASPAGWKRLRKAWRSDTGKSARLEYLHNRDTDLSGAIVSAAWSSAYGRWFASQILVNGGQPINPRYLLHRMAGQVFDKIMDGDIDVRGRRPGQMNYEPIPRTYWRSSAFLVREDPVCLWRIVLAPRGGVELGADGNIVRSDDPAATARTEQLRGCDSLLVDAYQFEGMFPRKDRIADKERRKFLLKAWWRGLDAAERRRLC